MIHQRQRLYILFFFIWEMKMPHTVELGLHVTVRGVCLGKTKYSHMHTHTCTYTQTYRHTWPHDREKYFLPPTSLALTVFGTLAWSRASLRDSVMILSRQSDHHRTPDSQTKILCFNLICLVSVSFYANISTQMGWEAHRLYHVQ